MYFPPPFIRPTDHLDRPAIVHVVSRNEDVLWNRPVFKAPPLVVRLPAFGKKAFASVGMQFAPAAS